MPVVQDEMVRFKVFDANCSTDEPTARQNAIDLVTTDCVNTGECTGFTAIPCNTVGEECCCQAIGVRAFPACDKPPVDQADLDALALCVPPDPPRPPSPDGNPFNCDLNQIECACMVLPGFCNMPPPDCHGDLDCICQADLGNCPYFRCSAAGVVTATNLGQMLVPLQGAMAYLVWRRRKRSTSPAPSLRA